MYVVKHVSNLCFKKNLWYKNSVNPESKESQNMFFILNQCFFESLSSKYNKKAEYGLNYSQLNWQTRHDRGWRLWVLSKLILVDLLWTSPRNKSHVAVILTLFHIAIKVHQKDYNWRGKLQAMMRWASWANIPFMTLLIITELLIGRKQGLYIQKGGKRTDI